jgi:signal transduction histidine kinase
VDVARSGQSVDVDVIDDGPGLSAADRRRAAERFWRAPDTSDAEGSGLGLPIVAALADASGGGLRLLPAYPRGLDAKLSLPAAELPADAADAPVTGAASAPAAQRLASR